ncbi:MAG TPA: GTPase Era, partial [Burkholderiaceae bacterium]|nr:GTPase Era [Burkholderiaceae bacterium]
LTRRMNDTVTRALAEVDAIVLVVDAHGWTREDDALLRLLPPPAEGCSKVILALNKTDALADRNALLPLLQTAAAKYPFAALVPVSAERGRQLDELLTEIERLLPAGGPLFDADQFTDRSVRFLAGELIREKAFRLLGEELPYGVAVAIERWEEDENRAEIVAALLVERESHKPIVIGAQGAKLREIGRLAREDIAKLLGKAVHLETWVRVKRGWTDDARALKSLGYE